MGSKLEAMLEAERRGILPADNLALLNEARSRGLVPPLQQDEPTFTVAQAQERSRLQQQLNERLAGADAAGKALKRTETVVGVARPLLRGAVDLADGALALPLLAASAPVAAYN